MSTKHERTDVDRMCDALSEAVWFGLRAGVSRGEFRSIAAAFWDRNQIDAHVIAADAIEAMKGER